MSGLDKRAMWVLIGRVRPAGSCNEEEHVAPRATRERALQHWVGSIAGGGLQPITRGQAPLHRIWRSDVRCGAHRALGAFWCWAITWIGES